MIHSDRHHLIIRPSQISFVPKAFLRVQLEARHPVFNSRGRIFEVQINLRVVILENSVADTEFAFVVSMEWFWILLVLDLVKLDWAVLKGVSIGPVCSVSRSIMR